MLSRKKSTILYRTSERPYNQYDQLFIQNNKDIKDNDNIWKFEHLNESTPTHGLKKDMKRSEFGKHHWYMNATDEIELKGETAADKEKELNGYIRYEICNHIQRKTRNYYQISKDWIIHE